ncbi:MAG TPA: hypothetical protein VED84_06795 [Acidimicrobiales bacterium]|nr:hypothetical protein [Acidimicrobiales bacterium]
MVALLAEGAKECGGFRVGVGGAAEEVADVARSFIDGGRPGGEACEDRVGVLPVEQFGVVRAVLDRDRLIVSGDGPVEQDLEDPELGRKQPGHGRFGYVGGATDCRDGGGSVPVFEELAGRCVDDGPACESGSGLAAAWRRPFDVLQTISICIALESREQPSRSSGGVRTVKTMTCQQLGGPCDVAHHGASADDVIKAQDRHLKDAVAGGDMTHENALKAMKGRWRHPKTSMSWYKRVKDAFAAFPED